jgi:hypothetical protein
MPVQVHLDLLQYQNQLSVKSSAGKRWIYDVIRKKWLILQPEEMVRQLVICHLIESEGYSKNRISLEKGLKVNALSRRFDVLVYDMSMSPFLLIECKAPQVSINQDVFKQVAYYNTTLKVPYLLVTNGIDTFCCAINYETNDFHFLNALPALY